MRWHAYSSPSREHSRSFGHRRCPLMEPLCLTLNARQANAPLLSVWRFQALSAAALFLHSVMAQPRHGLTEHWRRRPPAFPQKQQTAIVQKSPTAERSRLASATKMSMMAILASSSIQTYWISFKNIGEPECLESKLLHNRESHCTYEWRRISESNA